MYLSLALSTSAISFIVHLGAIYNGFTAETVLHSIRLHHEYAWRISQKPFVAWLIRVPRPRAIRSDVLTVSQKVVWTEIQGYMASVSSQYFLILESVKQQ
jgi:hypothetical protein